MANYDLNSITHGNDTYNLKDNSKIPLSGTNALSGSIVPDTNNSYDLGDSSHNFKIVYTKEIRNGLSTTSLILSGGNGPSNGARLSLNGSNRSDEFQGRFDLVAQGSTKYNLTGKPDGTLTWGSKNVAMQEDVVPRSGGYVLDGLEYSRPYSTGYLRLCGGYGETGGASLLLHGKLYTNANFVLKTTNGTDEARQFVGGYNGTLTWDGQPIQYTSDARLKQQISKIDTALLDAWEDVDLVQFKYNDAVDQKGKDNARLHTGYVVQQIDEACQKHDVDISNYGLYCHEEYPERTEEVEVQQEDGTIKKETRVIEEASEHYSLRYTEALIVECAYLRKCIKELKEEIKELKNK